MRGASTSIFYNFVNIRDHHHVFFSIISSLRLCELLLFIAVSNLLWSEKNKLTIIILSFGGQIIWLATQFVRVSLISIFIVWILLPIEIEMFSEEKKTICFDRLHHHRRRRNDINCPITQNDLKFNILFSLVCHNYHLHSSTWWLPLISMCVFLLLKIWHEFSSLLFYLATQRISNFLGWEFQISRKSKRKRRKERNTLKMI